MKDQTTSLKKPWSALEHKILSHLTHFGLEKHHQFLLAVSSGVDSVVMAYLMLSLKPKGDFVILHFHHGETKDEKSLKFRDQSQKSVQDFYNFLKNQFPKAKIELKIKKADKALKTEDDFRKARFEFFNECKEQYPHHILAVGHQAQDVLETRLLKLLRGSGFESLSHFKFWDHKILRPVLDIKKTEIIDFALHNHLKWSDDPTNQKTDYFRNWIREKWLKDLDQFKPGSVGKLAQSLDIVIEQMSKQEASDILQESLNFTLKNQTKKNMTLKKADYFLLLDSEKSAFLARVLRHKNIDFSQGQLKEIMKHLDKNQKSYTFKIAGINWFINAEQIVLEFKN